MPFALVYSENSGLPYAFVEEAASYDAKAHWLGKAPDGTREKLRGIYATKKKAEKELTNLMEQLRFGYGAVDD